MFEALFKFSRLNYAEGQIGFQVGGGWGWVAVLAVGLLAGLVVVYTLTDRYATARQKAVSLGLRIPIVLLLCLPLLQPVLIMPDVVPDENFVAVLVDASESMTIPDGPGAATRREEALRVLLGDGGDGGILPALREPFKVRLYAFGEQARRVDSLQTLPADQEATHLSAALARVLADFRGTPLSGIVLLTDGGDTSPDVPLNQAEQLRAQNIPLHIVGLGQEAFEQEREILDVTVAKGVEETTGAEIDVKVRSWGTEPAPVRFTLLDGDEPVFSETRRLKGSGKIDQFTFFYEPAERGAQELTLRLEEAPAERNTANNLAHLLVDTRPDTIRVLHFEGYPRPEFKFVRRALEDDQVVRFVSVTRTGTGTYYRQGIASPDELAGGFPRDQAELYRFKAVILGDIEASAFSLEQLRLLERFVRERGGGLLMLGGRSSFAEGDYWNTPVDDLLPVEIDPGRRRVLPPSFTVEGRPPAEQGFRFQPTAAGLESPILKLATDPEANARLWSEMPGLTSLNYLGAPRPGAVVLAEKPADDFGGSEPLLVVQRYGRGRSAALATASTFRWQMHLDAEDRRHERFWRQLARWLVADAPDRVNLDLAQDRVAPGEEITATVTLFDAAYAPLDTATPVGFVTDPQGRREEVAFQPDLTRPGTFTATFVPQAQGMYEMTVDADGVDADGVDVDGEVGRMGRAAQRFLVRPSRREFYDATLRRVLLERLATTSGGRYYAPAEAVAIPEELRSRRTSTSVYRAEPLWDLPILFGLLVLMLLGEWAYRRRRGLP
ncbi:hypothetical protein AWN76_010970 [Rhodothermaceae bacterium RA]|nr:hypothetical protein AWN76_010970 [Rhodothermaceae bacterium RA]